MGDTFLGSSVCVYECDLGFLVDYKLSMKSQCDMAAKKAILGYINRGIGSRAQDMIVPLYTVLVRPHLEHCVQFWRLVYRNDIEILERVQ